MKTKAEIVQNLLDSHQITAEHAVILLTPDAKEVQYIYFERQSPSPWDTITIPYNPFQGPYYVTCQQ